MIFLLLLFRGSIEYTGQYYWHSVGMMDANESEAIISNIVNQCKRTIMHFKGKEAENISRDFRDVDFANLYGMLTF